MYVFPLLVGTVLGIFIDRLRKSSKKEKASADGQGAWVLSVQSSVVHGYVGNKSAVFPLQTLGFEVDPVFTCQFSNHTAYPTCTGSRTSGPDLVALREGLTKNGFMPRYSALLTGYCSNASFLKELQQLAKDFRSLNPDGFFLCDPVLGDDGKLYVPEEFVQIYREIVPFASCVTPNQTEAELLTGMPLRTVSDARAVIQWFHDRGVKMVIITSCWLDRSLPDNSVLGPVPSANFIDVLASRYTKDEPKLFHLCIPKAPQGFTGTGDLTSALILGWLHILKEGPPHSTTSDRILCTALENTMATLQTVIQTTMQNKSLELSLIQSRDCFRSPMVEYRAVPVSA